MKSQDTTLSARNQISQRRAASLTTIVREAIEQMVIEGELSAGDRINESTLATKLGVSRGPIREACRSLEQAGLLESVINHGVFVRVMKLEEAKHLYEVRGALAGLVGRLIVERASDAEIGHLVKLVDDMDAAADQEDFETYYALNLRFHTCLVDAAANPVLTENYEDIVKKLHLFRRRGLVQRGSLAISNREHRTITDALFQRDADNAEAAMREHVLGGWSRLEASA